VLVHAGDITNGHTYDDAKIKDFYDWFEALPHPQKILVAGNHDSRKYANRVGANSSIMPALKHGTYLQDSGIRVKGGLLVWGSPWISDDDQYETYQPPASMKGNVSQTILNKWDLIPEDTAILVTHVAPCGYNLDDGTYCDKSLRDKIDSELPNVRLVVFGHSHSNGYRRVRDVTLVNGAIVNGHNDVAAKPKVVDVFVASSSSSSAVTSTGTPSATSMPTPVVVGSKPGASSAESLGTQPPTRSTAWRPSCFLLVLGAILVVASLLSG
jgi:predicted phosphodiesterase